MPDSLVSNIEAHAFSVQSLAGPSTCSPCVLGTQAQSELALPFQTMTRNGGYSRAVGQGHLTAGSGIWNTCLCGAIWS